MKNIPPPIEYKIIFAVSFSVMILSTVTLSSTAMTSQKGEMIFDWV